MNRSVPTSRIAVALWLALLASTPGCDDTLPTAPDASPRPVILVSDLSGLKPVAYGIDNLAITGRTIGLRTTVGGGCDEHFYDLYVSRDFTESFPVQTWAYLVHRSNDMCEALLTHRRQFNLKPLIDHYIASYGQEDAIIIHVYANSSGTGNLYTVRYEP